jgi:hypothetical protein
VNGFDVEAKAANSKVIFEEPNPPDCHLAQHADPRNLDLRLSTSFKLGWSKLTNAFVSENRRRPPR